MKIAKVRAIPPKGTASATAKSTKFVEIGYIKKQILPETDPRIKDCFEIFNTQVERDKKMKKRENIWAHYIFNDEINEEMQSRYESFFSGFLHYYDTELRNGMIDHTLLCHWHKKGKKDAVTVYLYPAPLRHPLKHSAPKSDIKTAEDYVNLMNDKNKVMKATIYNSSWTPPSPSGFQSDPPSPTGPPPPTP